MKYLFLFIFGVVFCLNSSAGKTIVEIKGEQFFINGKPTYHRANLEGEQGGRIVSPDSRKWSQTYRLNPEND